MWISLCFLCPVCCCLSCSGGVLVHCLRSFHQEVEISQENKDSKEKTQKHTLQKERGYQLEALSILHQTRNMVTHSWDIKASKVGSKVTKSERPDHRQQKVHNNPQLPVGRLDCNKPSRKEKRWNMIPVWLKEIDQPSSPS